MSAEFIRKLKEHEQKLDVLADIQLLLQDQLVALADDQKTLMDGLIRLDAVLASRISALESRKSSKPCQTSSPPSKSRSD